jgi:hypothetical protein
MVPPPQVLDLVQRFDRNREAYRSPHYNETQVRREFLDPLFKCLGWDIDNEQGYAEAYKDVIHEDAIKVGEATKAPDYCFRIGGTRKFFLEAKRPSVDIKNDVSPAYQLRRYAWTTKLPLSVLSDFEEFAVYDCRLKPDHTHSAAIGRILYIPYTDYPRRWDEIAGIFSRDAVLKGSFDKFADSTRAKGGTADVDDEFLKTIETWRADLARNLALRNPKLSQRELNFAVQRIIDRIIFLRIGEGRGIEDYGRLRALTNGDRIYSRLGQLFEEADTRYNSGLFHFKPEKGRHEAPDELTLALDIDDKLLRDIIRGLYYPESPYVFSALPADILGQVYEQFLGKVIRLTEGHRAVVEEKPEVKKAGGVYYTPTYVVDYIVQTTIGHLLEGKTPKQAAKLKILDPACGSGSFLIGAYEYLLKWHRDFYTKDSPEKWAKGAKPVLVQVGPGNWKLTIAERKRILLDNIFGVDIDTQAVETTKLSLLLKVLEGETQQSLQPVLRLFHERALPDLGDNIKCGNSLIGPDFYQQQQMPLIDDEERYRINVFDWWGKDGFPVIKQAGGFDAVIGNPPYGAFTGEAETAYFRATYDSPANSLDTFLLFVEKSHHLLKHGGMMGMIIPSGWVSTPSAEPLRRLFLRDFQPLTFVSLPFDVFKAYIDTVIITARHLAAPAKAADDEVSLVVFPSRFRISAQEQFGQFEKKANYKDWLAGKHLKFLITCSRSESKLLQKVQNQPASYGNVVSVKRGIETFNPTETRKGLINPQPAFKGVLQRYTLELGDPMFISHPPEIQESKPFEDFSQPRILLRQVLSRKLRLQAVFTTETLLTNQSVQSLLIAPSVKNPVALEFLLGVLNSKLISWYFVNINSVARRDDFPKIIIQQTRDLPLPGIHPDSHLAQHDQIARFAKQMLALQQRLSAARTPQETTALERQVAATDTQLDTLIYALYGLTDSEIKIVEASG